MKELRLFILISVFLFGSCSSDDATPEGPIDDNPELEEPSNPEVPEEEPEISDENLLDLTQKETFKYFWDYAEENSGAARERYLPDNPLQDAYTVTVGGMGFGLMSIIVGIERQFISRTEGTKRFEKIINFLENADRFHGAWPHWIDGRTGTVIPFSDQDDGADLVETAFLVQGLITVGEYLKTGNDEEQQLAEQAFNLIEEVEWDWFTQGQEVLYWHWSPNSGFSINLKLKGYNETLITYILAAASRNYGIDKSVYNTGWASNGGIQSPNNAYGYSLLLNHAGADQYGGPLFWSHYSYLGLNPTNLVGPYTNYWDVNRNHTLINYSYCVENPLGYRDYGENLWGLTASYSRNDDGSLGYNAHRPGVDVGVISPTAAISSIPYTPEKSFDAMRYFYANRETLLGPAGFYDAFSPQYNFWVAEAYLAIDQGPQIIMIENYRSGLLWDLFMRNEQVQSGLDKLGFSY